MLVRPPRIKPAGFRLCSDRPAGSSGPGKFVLEGERIQRCREKVPGVECRGILRGLFLKRLLRAEFVSEGGGYGWFDPAGQIGQDFHQLPA
jgi:hypothetical protein